MASSSATPETAVPGQIMEEAAKLCELLFGWLEKREQCASKLLELAQELENARQKVNISQDVGPPTLELSIFAAALALLKGGLASALWVTAALGTVTSRLVEAGVSSSAFNTTIALIKEDEKVGMSIQQLLQDLRNRCGGGQLGAQASESTTDDVECEVATQIMWALARRNKTMVPLNLLRSFNRAMFFRQASSGGLALAEASQLIYKALDLGESGLKVSAKEMVKDIGTIGMRAAAKAGSKAQSLYDVIEIMKSNQVTEASKFLHDSAREIREGRTKLQDQLDAMKEITQKLLQLKELVKDLGAYSLDMTEVGQRIIDYIIGTCTDDLVVSWLQLNQNTFINILCFYLERLNYILGDFSKHRERHIDIVFVAHGRINTVFMPAGSLAPSPNIRNTILYSPWNCKIDEYAAYSIAQGSIDMRNRYFKNLFNCEPNPLPDHWNYMRQSRHNIPEIILSPLVPEEPAWTQFMTLCTQGIIDIDGRAIIPYLVPKDLVTAFGEIPFMVFVFAASFMLDFYGATATVHLAACLGRAESSPMPVEWRTQYAYTYDGAFMSVNIDEMKGIPTLLRAFLLLFNRNHR